MDWTKAKNILIAALIITNLVLIATYAFQKNLFNSSEKQVMNETVELLKEKNIYIKPNIIPKEHNEMATLSVEYDNGNQNAVKKELKKQTAVTKKHLTDEDLIKMTTEFIDRCGLLTKNVTYDRIQRDGDIINVYYKNVIDNVTIEKSYINCTVKNGKITAFDRYWLNPVEYSKAKKEIIPAVAALLKFMIENQGDEKVNVKDISLVYWLDSSSFDSESPVFDTAMPYWKITYNHGKKDYFWAFEQ